jgi:hypothetical protein
MGWKRLLATPVFPHVQTKDRQKSVLELFHLVHSPEILEVKEQQQ